jgi:L-lactate dehydrogenase
MQSSQQNLPSLGLFQKISGIPKSRVFGSGTFLDSMRLRTALGNRVGIAPSSIHAYVVGQHGDFQVPLWSCAHVSGIPLQSIANLSLKDLDEIALKTKQKAYEIIAAKGST